MATKYLDSTGLTYLWSKIKSLVTGHTTLTISGDNQSLKVGNTTVNVPKKTSQLTNDSGFITTGDIPEGAAASTTTPLMDGTAAVGTELAFARGDHRHPSDTSKADKVSGATSGNLAALDANGNLTDSGVSATSVGTDTKNTAGSTADANKLYIIGAKSQAANPQTYSQVNAYIKAGKVYSNAIETVNLSDEQTLTNKTLTSPTLNGTPIAPTASAGTNTTQVATTQFVTTAITNASDNYVPATAKGAANGVAPLDSNSKIDAQYLPSYVDDVIEAYARSGQTALSQNWLATGSATGTVIVPEAGKIYVLMADSGDYTANTQFRWGGTAYVKLNDGGISAITNAEIDVITAN